MDGERRASRSKEGGMGEERTANESLSWGYEEGVPAFQIRPRIWMYPANERRGRIKLLQVFIICTYHSYTTAICSKPVESEVGDIES